MIARGLGRPPSSVVEPRRPIVKARTAMSERGWALLGRKNGHVATQSEASPAARVDPSQRSGRGPPIRTRDANRQWRTPCQLNRRRLTISASLGAGDPDRRQGGRHADTTRIRGFRFMRDLRNYGVCGYCSIGPRYAARSQRRRHAKDLVADRRSSAGLCDGTCGSDNRAGSAARATHASGNRIRLCLGRWFRASHTRSTDPHTQSRRCLPNTARNAPCGWKGWRRQVQNSYHLCCGEGKTPRISSLSICESGAHLFAAWCLRII